MRCSLIYFALVYNNNVWSFARVWKNLRNSFENFQKAAVGADAAKINKMGNCLRIPDPDSDSTNDVGLLPASKQVFDKDSLQIDSFGGTHFASSAHFASSQNQNTFCSIHQCSQDTVLIGLVEGAGVHSALTSGFVKKHLLSTFQEASQHHGGLDQHNQEDILSATLQSLHHEWLHLICLVTPKTCNPAPASPWFWSTFILVNALQRT
jgi:hypothetical protein